MNPQHFRPMVAIAVTGLLALTISGCQGDTQVSEAPAPLSASTGTSTATASTSASPAPASTGPTAEVAAPFAPVLNVAVGSQEYEVMDNAGSVIAFTVAYPVVELTGVEPGIAEKFATAAAAHKDAVFESAQAYSKFTLPECQGACERESSFIVEHAGLYKDYGTLAGTSGYILGSRDRNPGVHSVTMNLKTGEFASLGDFMDLGDPLVVDRAAASLAKTDNWASCQETVPEYLSSATGFSPTDEGVLLLWPVNYTYAAQCGVDKVVVPWASASTDAAEQAAPAADAVPEAAAPVEEDINGRWCPSAESRTSNGCVTVALPSATDENTGHVSQIRHIEGAGTGFLFVGEGAPFGAYYPAGVALVVPDYYPGTDIPEQDRIWNSQTGTLFLRQ